MRSGRLINSSCGTCRIQVGFASPVFPVLVQMCVELSIPMIRLMNQAPVILLQQMCLQREMPRNSAFAWTIDQ